MRGLSTSLAAAITALAFATAAQAQSRPITGTWAGTASQDGPSATPFTVRLTTDGARGTIEYVAGSIVCRGTLEAVRGQRNVYLERITVNRYDMNAARPTGCIDGGTLTLTRTPSGRVTYDWLIDWGNDFVRANGELAPAR